MHESSPPLSLLPEEMARLRAEIAAAAPAFAPAMAPGVEIVVVPQAFFRHHRILEVQATRAFPARQLHVASGADGGFRVLTGHLPHLNAVAAAEPPRIPEVTAVRAYMNLGDFWTTENELGELQISSFGEIPWIADLPPSEQAMIDTLRESLADEIGPPTLTQEGPDHVLGKWLVSDRRLIYRELRLSPHGQLQRTDEVLDKDLPVHPGHLWGLVNDRFVPIG